MVEEIEQEEVNWEDIIEETKVEDYEIIQVEALDECQIEESIELSKSIVVPASPINNISLNLSNSSRSPHVPIDPADDERIKSVVNMVCDICKQPLDSFSQARLHFRVEHNTIGYLVCCGRKFKQRNRLIDHVDHSHYNISYPCKECNKSFESRSYLLRHMVQHQDEKIYVSKIQFF
jgi:hypothetical protein